MNDKTNYNLFIRDELRKMNHKLQLLLDSVPEFIDTNRNTTELLGSHTDDIELVLYFNRSYYRTSQASKLNSQLKEPIASSTFSRWVRERDFERFIMRGVSIEYIAPVEV